MSSDLEGTLTPPDSSSGRRYAGNALWLLIAQIGGKVASFVLVVIVARGLGAREYGIFNFAISFAPLFLSLGMWGLDIALIREVARNPKRLSELFSSGIALRTAMGLAGLGVSLAIAPTLLETGDAITALLVIGLALLVDELSAFLGSVFKAFERMGWHAVVMLFNRIGSTALAGVALAAGGDLVAVCTAYLIGSIAAFLFGWWALKTKFPPTRLRDARRSVVIELAKIGAPLGIAAFFGIMVFRIDAVLLQGFEGPIAVAMYGIAYRFFESFLFISWGLANVALPRMARAKDAEGSRGTFELTGALMLACYLPLAIGAPFAAEGVVVALFGDRYADAAPAVAWLTAAAVLYAMAHLARVSLAAIGKQRSIAWISGAALVVNVAVNLVVIPRYGFVGAAAATFATEIVEAGLLLTMYWRLAHPRVGRAVIVPVVAGLVMGLALVLAGVEGLAAVAVGVPAYLVGLAASALLIAPAEVKRAAATLRRPSRATT